MKPVPILNQINLVHAPHLRLDLPSGSFLQGFPTKILDTPLPSSMRATCLAHPIPLDISITCGNTWTLDSPRV